MSFSSNFKTRMLFFDQSYDTTNYRWVTYQKIKEGGERVGIRMVLRQAPIDVMAETYVDGSIILYKTFNQLDRRVRDEIRHAINEVAILVHEEIDPNYRYSGPSLQIFQRKQIYAPGVTVRRVNDFADYLTKKFLGGSQQSVQSAAQF